MRLLGARQVAEEAEKGAKGIKSVGTAAGRTGSATARTAKHTSVLTNGYRQLGKAARYGIGFLGVGGLFALQSAITNTEELSKTTTGLNRNLGLSTQVGSQWAAVAHARGIATTALNMSFTKMGKSFVEANRKGGTARTALNQLGITQAQTTKGAHNFNYALGLVSKKFGEAEAGPKRQSAAMSLLGKGYSTVLPLFAQGSKGLQEQLHWANEYGVTLDGKTNKSLMDLVNAQRQSKVAMLGLEVGFTKMLLPAIKGAEGEFQLFSRTLNDPKLSNTEKITKIGEQFERLENKLITLISDALPKVAEHAGQLGIKMAGALWHGFVHSSPIGKLAIAAWMFDVFGGKEVMKAGAKKVGGEIGTEMGIGLALGLIGAFIGYEVWQHLSDRTRTAVIKWGWNAGANFINFFVKAVNGGIQEINETLNNANALSFLGVHAPQIGEVGEVGGLPGAGKPRFGGPNKHFKDTPPRHFSTGQKRKGYEALWGVPPPSGPPPWPPPRKSHKHARASTSVVPQAATASSDQPLVIHNKIYLDGKQVAQSVLHHGEAAAARK